MQAGSGSPPSNQAFPGTSPAWALDVQLAQTRAGAEINEDVVGYCANAAWVIDGASGVGPNFVPGDSDARWFASQVDRILKTVITRCPDIPIAELLRQVITRCADAFAEVAMEPASTEQMQPSAAFALVRHIRDRVEMVTLGDCEILYRLDGSSKVVRHCDAGKLSQLEGKTINLARNLIIKDPDISQAALIEALRPQLIDNRKQMNQPGGYWILSLNERVIPHIHHRILPAGRMDFILSSDGFLRLRDLFGACDNSDLLSIENATQFNRFYSQLRALEAAPESVRRYTRVKCSDDASLIRARLHTNNDPPR